MLLRVHLVLSLLPTLSLASSLTCTWTGNAGDGKWTTAGNWSGCGAGTPGQTYPADSSWANLSTGTVLLDSSTTVGGSASGPSLSIDSGATLNLAPAASGSTTLTLGPTGAYAMSVSGALNLAASTTVTLAGSAGSGPAWVNRGGVVTLSGGSIVQSGSAAMTLTNGGIIQGYGTLGNNTNLIISNLGADTNNPTIRANVSGQTLTIDPAGDRNGTGFLNSGALEAGVAAGSAATLRLVDGNFNSGVNRVGYIRANAGGIISIENSNVLNGSVYAGAGGEIRLSNSTIRQGGPYTNGLNVGTGGILNAVAGTSTITGGSTYNNNSGLITATTGATLVVDSMTMLSAGTGTLKPNGGTIILQNGAYINGGTVDATAGQIQLNSGTIGRSNQNVPLSVVNGPGGGIVNTGGSSNILAGGYLATFDNQAGGVIDAQAGTLTLTGSSAINNGTFHAGSGGTLALAGSWTNAGAVAADSGGVIQLSTARVNAGTITLNPGATLETAGTSTLGTVALVQNGTVHVAAGSTLRFSNSGSYTQGAGAATILDGAMRTNAGDLTINGGAVTVNSGGAIAPTVDFVNAANFSTNAVVTVNSGGGISAAGYTQNGGTLSITGTVATSSGAFTENAGIVTINSGGKLNLGGNFVQSAGATLNVNGTLTQTGGTFSEYGNVSVGAGVTMATRAYNEYGGNLTVNGTLSATAFMNSGGALTVAGTLTASSGTAGYTQTGGSLEVASGGVLSATRGYLQSGGTADIDGTLSVGTGRSITVNGGVLEGDGTLTGPVTVANGGTLEGTPAIRGSLTIGNRGTLSIGNSPGIMNVTGNYAQLAGSEWDVDLWGPDAGTGYDQLNVIGNVSLAGTLKLNLNYDPKMPATFVLLTYTGILSGDWNQVIFDYKGPWHLDEGAGKISLRVDSAVPEPSTFGMIGLALVILGVLGSAARRKRTGR